MNTQALIKAKRELYLQLLLKNYNDYTDKEIDILYALANDRDIQDHYEKRRQADLQKTNTPGGK